MVLPTMCIAFIKYTKNIQRETHKILLLLKPPNLTFERQKESFWEFLISFFSLSMILSWCITYASILCTSKCLFIAWICLQRSICVCLHIYDWLLLLNPNTHSAFFRRGSFRGATSGVRLNHCRVFLLSVFLIWIFNCGAWLPTFQTLFTLNIVIQKDIHI